VVCRAARPQLFYLCRAGHQHWYTWWGLASVLVVWHTIFIAEVIEVGLQAVKHVSSKLFNNSCVQQR
jgi:hypothetical protein